MPELISPDQPAMAIRTLSHEAAPGLSVSCRLEGDTFEMEDQRNWTDASFKTYVRPGGSLTRRQHDGASRARSGGEDG